MHYYQTISILSSLLVTVSGHTSLVNPASFKDKSNPNVKTPDYDNMAPLAGAGAFPCKGYHTAALADPTGEGKPTGAWKTGESASLTFSDGAKHEGGSCQVSLSTDSGTTWKVLHSWMGGCPLSAVSFTVPGDAPTGTQLGAWTWFNKLGNREMYMNCFAVDIQKGSGGSPAVPFSSRPDMFVANIGTNTCQVLAEKQASFPNPGPDVT
ncbi:lytic polysaccharide monooxygenase, partial [Cadophora sp. DSE1049]